MGSRLILTWKDKKSGEQKRVRFDAVTSESHEAVMAITSFPVEEGPDVSDHARPDQDRVTIEGYVSNKPTFSNPGVDRVMAFKSTQLKIPEKRGGPPLVSPGGLTSAVSGAVGSLLSGPPADKMQVLTPSGTWKDRAREMFELLDAARLSATRLTIISPKVRTVEDMLIERIAVPRTTADGEGLTFQIDLVKVRIVSSETVDAPVPTELRGMPQVSKGSQSTKEADDDAKKREKAASIAANLFDGGKGLLGAVGF